MGRTVGEVGEETLIETYIRPIATGIGDDVAYLVPPENAALLVSSDAMVENVHFLRCSPADWVGQKALRTNLSDIASSGGTPKWVTMAISLPGDLETAWFAEFTKGFGEVLRSSRVRLIGGDITSSPRHICLTITIIGVRQRTGSRADVRSLTRAGAQPGHVLAVTGTLGESLPGLEVILGKRILADKEVSAHWQKRHFFPPSRVAFSQRIYPSGWVSAMMDLSDGLATDVTRMALASKVGMRIDMDAVPMSHGFLALGYTAMDAVLAGEDYELLMTVPEINWLRLLAMAKSEAVPLSRIGMVLPGSGVGYFQANEPVNLPKNPWHHF